jgi:hypothetical protein
MKRLFLAAVLVLAQFGARAAFAAECVEPPPVTDIPNGASATREQMLSAQRTIKAYDIAVKTYSDCLRDSNDVTNRANQAVEKLQKLAEKFNVQLIAFKERNGAS